MQMTVSQKRQFIERELGYELRCLLGAATLWQILKNEGAGFNVVIAMDSVFVHTRTLFNFFTKSKGQDISISEFGPSPYQSTLFDLWENPLNRHVLHISKGRANPINTQTSGHLNEQVVLFANEILNLWDKFALDPAATNFASVIKQTRADAIKAANDDAEGKITPIFQ